jgi:L-lactate permease
MSIFPDEYFFGFEMLRPIFIWTILREKTESLKQQVLALIRTWLPYALITGLFLYWRIIIFKFPTKYQPIFSNADSSQFVVNLVNIGKAILDDFFEVLFFSWIQIFEPLRGVYSVSLSTIAL